MSAGELADDGNAKDSDVSLNAFTRASPSPPPPPPFHSAFLILTGMNSWRRSFRSALRRRARAACARASRRIREPGSRSVS